MFPPICSLSDMWQVIWPLCDSVSSKGNADNNELRGKRFIAMIRKYVWKIAVFNLYYWIYKLNLQFNKDFISSKSNIYFLKEMYLFGKHINKPVLKYGQSVLYEIWRSVCSGSVMLEERKEIIKEDKEKRKEPERVCEIQDCMEKSPVELSLYFVI